MNDAIWGWLVSEAGPQGAPPAAHEPGHGTIGPSVKGCQRHLERYGQKNMVLMGFNDNGM